MNEYIELRSRIRELEGIINDLLQGMPNAAVTGPSGNPRATVELLRMDRDEAIEAARELWRRQPHWTQILGWIAAMRFLAVECYESGRDCEPPPRCAL